MCLQHNGQLWEMSELAEILPSPRRYVGKNQRGLGRGGNGDSVWTAGRKTAEIQAGLDSSSHPTTVCFGDL